MSRYYSFILASLSSLILLSCESSNQPNKANYAFADGIAYKKQVSHAVSDGYWDKPAGLTGPHKIVVSLGMQHAKYFIGDRQVGFTMVSTGTDNARTPVGRYKVLSKDEDHRSSKYGSIVDAEGNTIKNTFVMGKDVMPPGGKYKGAPMFYGLQMNYTGIWMHEGFVTSAPESRGCIRLPHRMAKIFYENAAVGTPIIVEP